MINGQQNCINIANIIDNLYDISGISNNFSLNLFLNPLTTFE